MDETDHQFRSMLEGFEEDEEEVSCHVAEKKRRLGAEQVKALEKNFEVENKLEPERKVQLARELGLQPRQVAVWFQNRRARWKTKQLERDYGVLKANYDALKLDFDALHRDNETLLKQIMELKSKLNEDNSESDLSVKEEKASPEDDDPLLLFSDHRRNIDNDDAAATATNTFEAASKFVFRDHFRDGSSDSDSSAVMNDAGPGYDDVARAQRVITNDMLPHLAVKVEEHNFFSDETTCHFFSDEQAPTLQSWYCSGEEEQWS